MEMISLDDFAGGALKERVNQAILQVLENIADPNTSVKLKRKVTVDITFEANESREMAQVSVVAKCKLAPRDAVKSVVLIDTDMSGLVMGTEFKKQIPGQQAIIIDKDSGEVTSPKLESGIKRVK